ncbi:MAG TPA: AbrB/MazE/SpoVT family DNA-binding domain-containing protein [Patescibacteria group bacterium]|nr:AbrB/MazE/SpoVT family DNA-binding domain-containing protein [Patescibacteria group bacterium]
MTQLKQIEKIKVWERGQITIPKEFREELEIKENDILYAEKLGNGLYLRPSESVIDQVQKKMSAMMKKRGLTVDDLIKDLIDEEN